MKCEAEKSSLRAFLASGELSAKDLREVFEEFVATTWKETMADHHVSDLERQRLREIVRVLGLDASILPREWRSILSG